MIRELDPHNFQGVVERHVLDCEFPNGISDRSNVFIGEAQELVEAVIEDDREHILEEVGDVLFSLFSLMNSFGISFEEATTAVMDKNMTRFNSAIAQELRESGIEEGMIYQAAKERVKINS